MKRFALEILIIAFAATCFFVACNKLLAATATGSIGYDLATEPPCAGVITDQCIDHLEVWDVTATPAKLADVPTVPAASQQPTSVPFSFKIGPPYGTRTWTARAVARSGATQVSSGNSPIAQVTVKPGTPASFTVILQ